MGVEISNKKLKQKRTGFYSQDSFRISEFSKSQGKWCQPDAEADSRIVVMYWLVFYLWRCSWGYEHVVGSMGKKKVRFLLPMLFGSKKHPDSFLPISRKDVVPVGNWCLGNFIVLVVYKMNNRCPIYWVIKIYKSVMVNLEQGAKTSCIVFSHMACSALQQPFCSVSRSVYYFGPCRRTLPSSSSNFWYLLLCLRIYLLRLDPLSYFLSIVCVCVCVCVYVFVCWWGWNLRPWTQ